MKKILTLIGLVLAGVAIGQLSFNSFTTNSQVQADVVTIITTNLPSSTFTNTDALVIGQQLGAMTNSAGQPLFSPGTYTNHNSVVTFTITDFGQMIPTSIAVCGTITK